MLSEKDKATILNDFIVWSGGFQPNECTTDQVLTYCQAALSKGYGEQNAYEYLMTVGMDSDDDPRPSDRFLN